MHPPKNASSPFLLFFLILPAFLALFPSKVYGPRIPGLLERVQEPLYDRNTVAESKTTLIDFFEIPGTGDGPVRTGKPDGRGIYVLAEPIDLIPQQDFRCDMDFPITKISTEPLYGDGVYEKMEIPAGVDNFGDMLNRKAFGGAKFDAHAFSESVSETGGDHPKHE